MGKGGVGAPFARLIANLLVMGTGVISRAFVEAYKQALKSAPPPDLLTASALLAAHVRAANSWASMRADGGAAASKGASKAKSLQADARLILNVKPKATEAEIIEVTPAAACRPLTSARAARDP